MASPGWGLSAAWPTIRGQIGRSVGFRTGQRGRQELLSLWKCAKFFNSLLNLWHLSIQAKHRKETCQKPFSLLSKKGQREGSGGWAVAPADNQQGLFAVDKPLKLSFPQGKNEYEYECLIKMGEINEISQRNQQRITYRAFKGAVKSFDFWVTGCFSKRTEIWKSMSTKWIAGSKIWP